MQRIRVLVVDDSAVIRRMLTDILAADPAIEVVGTAGSGEDALAKLATCQPDVVTLDVEMPAMSGLEALVELKRRAPRTSVIMFSSLTQRAAATTLDALARGAADYVTKPSNTGSREASIDQVRAQLLPKIKGLARPQATAMPTRTKPRASSSATPEVVVIASSTGGPNALATLIAKIPPNFPLPIAIVQHMPPMFTRILAERLSQLTSLAVQEAGDGELVGPGRIVIAPGDYHLELERQDKVRTKLVRSAPENSCRPAADVLFRSAAATYRGRVLGVVLTGMGQDGLRGCEAIRAQGGQVIAQDEPSSVVWGMPGAVVEAGLAEEVVALDDIADCMVRRTTSDARRKEVQLG